MNDLFLIISILSFVGIVIFVILAITQFVKKNSPKGKKHIMFAGIAGALMLVSFIGFGLTTDPTEVSKDAGNKKVETAAKPKEKTTEEIAEQETKEAEAKESGEQKTQEKAEQEEKSKQEKKEADIAAKKANAKTIDYPQLKKNPDRYKGEYVKYTGKIIQILEGKDITNIRLAVTETEFGYDYDDEIFIEYDGYTDYVDEDIITVYGEIYGTYTYVSQAGYNISLPGLIAEEFE